MRSHPSQTGVSERGFLEEVVFELSFEGLPGVIRGDGPSKEVRPAGTWS